MLTIEATGHLLKRGHLEIFPSGKIAPAGFNTRLKYTFFPGYCNRQIQKIATMALDQLNNHTEGSLEFGEAFLERYKDKPLFKEFDRALALYRPELSYKHPKNILLLRKWTHAELPPEILRDFPT